ncbi:MAG: hypothetical protein KGD63_01400 [Candidatus Lokiarchaeota archaeon]|nr:hypothetical protein [Candidatus Lokiarchaeota archaeon]
MIKNVYILRTNGMLLYSKNFIKQKYDDNLLIGFFTSIVNFSREALDSIVKFVDLGEDNKLILEPKPEEKIFGAAIVSSKDNTLLVSKILGNILQDFIDDFSPDYLIDTKSMRKVDIIAKENLKRKTAPSLRIRLIETWLILIPLGILLTFLNIMATEYFVSSLYYRFFSMDEILISIIPQVVIISLVELILVFGIANFISGYITLNLRIAALNTLLYFGYILIFYFISVKPVLGIIIITFFPFIIIASLVASYVGHILALQKKTLK